MSLFWHLVCFSTLFAHSVRCDSIESNPLKSTERDESSNSHQLAYESQNYPTQSMTQSMINSNGYNGNQNQMSLSESNSAQMYGSGHQTNDQLDQKERKTLILAIPVKLKLNEQNNYGNQELSESESQMGAKSLLYSKSLPYGSPYPQHSRHPSLASHNSDDSDPNLSKESSLLPLSHKIYSSPIESQLKSASYSTVNTQKSVSEQPSTHNSNNEQKYKTSYDTKDYKSTPNQFGRDRDVNTNRDYPMIGDYQGMVLKNDRDPDSGYELVKSYSFRPPKSEQLSQEDSYNSRIRQKENSKHLYESIPKSKPSEFDYDSQSDDEEDEEEDKTIKLEQIYHSLKDYQNNKQAFNQKNNKKNNSPVRPNEPKPSIGSQYSKNTNKGMGHTMPVYIPDAPYDGWPQYNFYSKPSLNDWTGVPESVDSNLLGLMNSYKKPSKNSPRAPPNPLYAPAFDILGDSLKVAASTIPLQALPNSKIYGQAAKYQSSYPQLSSPLNLFAGYGQDYGLMELNGDLYPAPSIVGQSPPRKAHMPHNQKELLAIEYNSGNRDSIKSHRRNPLLLRPSFMSGLRSVANKPLANYSPFASASTTQSFLSVLPSLPSLQTSFNINTKSIPRQIFPLLYG